MTDITSKDVEAAQELWAIGVIEIGQAYREDGDFVARARDHIAKLYGYEAGPVVFKPTLSGEHQFRNTVDAALSYFVGNNAAYPQDHGFALRPWEAIRFENSGIIPQGNTALAMGNYYFRDYNGDEIKVEFSFGYVRSASGALLINLHHSSLPHQAN